MEMKCTRDKIIEEKAVSKEIFRPTGRSGTINRRTHGISKGEPSWKLELKLRKI